MKNIFSLSAFIMGVLAFLLSITPFFIDLINPALVNTEESQPFSFGDLAKKSLKLTISRTPAVETARILNANDSSLNNIIFFSANILGGFGLLFCIIAYMRSEYNRYYIGSAIICLIALAISCNAILVGILGIMLFLVMFFNLF